MDTIWDVPCTVFINFSEFYRILKNTYKIKTCLQLHAAYSICLRYLFHKTKLATRQFHAFDDFGGPIYCILAISSDKVPPLLHVLFKHDIQRVLQNRFCLMYHRRVVVNHRFFGVCLHAQVPLRGRVLVHDAPHPFDNGFVHALQSTMIQPIFYSI